MLASNTSDSSRTERSPAVAFIHHRLQNHHPLFKKPPPEFDSLSGRFVEMNQALAPSAHGGVIVTASDTYAGPLSTLGSMPARPAWTDVSAMKFWAIIFQESMDKFMETPRQYTLQQMEFEVRGKKDWDAVYATLEQARAKYQETGGKVGWMRKVRRRVADNVTPAVETARTTSKVAPNDLYLTPVLGAVEVILDAVQAASRVRKQALEGFDGLLPIFSDVELFIGTFPRDAGIRNASVDLTVATLRAVERAIVFFTGKEVWRGAKAILSGADYEKGLIESLNQINAKSKSLMIEAAKSHIHEFHMYSQETQRFRRELIPIITQGYNSIHSLLTDHLKEKDRELERARQENLHLRVENGRLRANSPLRQIDSSPQFSQPPLIEEYITQGALHNMFQPLGLDSVDITTVLNKKNQLPEKERSRSEHLASMELFQRWMISPHGTKLLVHWNNHRPKTISGISALSVFCVSITQILRGNSRFISLLWIYGLHVDNTGPRSLTGARAMLISFLDQLLRQYVFDTRSLHYEVDLQGIQSRDLDSLVGLLKCLIQKISKEITLVFVVDGVSLLERPEFEDEALHVLAELLKMSGDESIGTTVKILFASTPGTNIVRGAFERENLIIEMGTVPQLMWASSEERLSRDLGI